jgi:UDP-glucose 4,6-dehydratase
MNLLVTGGYGFIGSNFINYYFHKVDLLVNIDAMYYCASEDNVLSEIRNSVKYKFVKGNLRSKDLVDFILKEYSITHIIHFAAQSHVQNSFDDSMQYTLDNIVGTHTLLDCCKKCPSLKKMIHVSTDEVYGESDELCHETSLLLPTNPYAATKAAAEMLVMSYIKSYNLPIVISRGNNVYGPGQYPEKLIPRFIQQLKNGKLVTIQGDGSAKRSFLHVFDTCTAFEIILEKGVLGEIYNIGTREEHTVMDIAKILIKLIKNTDDYEKNIIYIEDRPFNDSRYFISNEKLASLNWEIKIDFLEGIKTLVSK